MIELLRTVSLKRNGNFKDIPITLIKTITLGDIITLDRAVQRDTRSVVYFITKIDPAEIEADLEKLRNVILNLEESLRSATANGKTEIQDDSLFNYFVAPFRQRPRPKLLTEHQANKITAKVDSKILASASSTGDMPLLAYINIVQHKFLSHAISPCRTGDNEHGKR